jgi:hypothetical protein
MLTGGAIDAAGLKEIHESYRKLFCGRGFLPAPWMVFPVHHSLWQD